MKKAVFILLTICLFAVPNATAQLGRSSYGAICPFESAAEFWNKEMGTLFAEELRRRTHLSQQVSFMPVEETEGLLKEAGIENATDADPRELRNAFWQKHVRFVVTGKIENVYIIRDVDGTPYADVEIRFTVTDIAQEAGAFTQTVKYRTKATKYVTAETPYDKDIALSILGGGANRASEKLRTGIRDYLRRTRNIF